MSDRTPAGTFRGHLDGTHKRVAAKLDMNPESLAGAEDRLFSGDRDRFTSVLDDEEPAR
jgi:hypothetical protein